MQSAQLELIDATRNIRLIAATLDTIAEEERSVAGLCAGLGVAPPSDWPPPLFDANALAWTRSRLQADPAAQGWFSWYVIAPIADQDTLVGVVGYKGPPKAGTVEVGYSILPAYQLRGFASAAVRLLVSHAFAQDVREVAAETLPDLIASQRVLTACGFTLDSRREEPDHGIVLRYVRRRAASS